MQDGIVEDPKRERTVTYHVRQPLSGGKRFILCVLTTLEQNIYIITADITAVGLQSKERSKSTSSRWESHLRMQTHGASRVLMGRVAAGCQVCGGSCQHLLGTTSVQLVTDFSLLDWSAQQTGASSASGKRRRHQAPSALSADCLTLFFFTDCVFVAFLCNFSFGNVSFDRVCYAVATRS